MKNDTIPCLRAPYGWKCTREARHNGPCATEPDFEPTEPAEGDTGLTYFWSGIIIGLLMGGGVTFALTHV